MSKLTPMRVTLLWVLAATPACGDDHLLEDAAWTDASSHASAVDAGAPLPMRVLPPPPARLFETGLYAQDAQGRWTLAPGVESFHPRFELWSDGAEKTRWVWLPPGSTIDTRDMDHWSLPVGTRLWKEFRVGTKRVETRFIERTGPEPDAYRFASYTFVDAGDDALLVSAKEGLQNARGTGHDIPTQEQCGNCHASSRERVLGFGAIQLSHDGVGATIRSLSDEGRLSLPARAGFPGFANPLAQKALGYLHANCGHCHSEDGISALKQPVWLRLSTTDRSETSTAAYRTLVNQRVELTDLPGRFRYRVRGGDAAASALIQRMTLRNPVLQMPPLGTKRVDDPGGLETLRAWIGALPPPDSPDDLL